MTSTTFKENTLHMENRQISGTADLSATLVSGTAVVDATVYGGGIVSQRLVTLTTSDAHGFAVGSQVYIEGTTNYNGTHDITAVTTSGITIKVSEYVAETPNGTETVKFVVDPQCDFVLYEVNLHLSSTATTSENFVAQLDANAGSAYDLVVVSEDVQNVSDIAWSGEKYLFSGDKIRFTLPNTDGLTYGLDVKYRRVR
jgi:hypothetical protein